MKARAEGKGMNARTTPQKRLTNYELERANYAFEILQFSYDGNGYIASAFGVQIFYAIRKEGDVWALYCPIHGLCAHERPEPSHQTLEDAQKAAQVDFQNRVIRSFRKNRWL